MLCGLAKCPPSSASPHERTSTALGLPRVELHMITSCETQFRMFVRLCVCRSVPGFRLPVCPCVCPGSSRCFCTIPGVFLFFNPPGEHRMFLSTEGSHEFMTHKTPGIVFGAFDRSWVAVLRVVVCLSSLCVGSVRACVLSAVEI